mgnify:CR=1 FL=1
MWALPCRTRRGSFAADFPPLPYAGWELTSARTYAVRQVDERVVRKILEQADLDAPFRDLEGDAELAATAIREGLREILGGDEVEAIDVLRPLFLRNKGAYIVGRARCGAELMPLIHDYMGTWYWVVPLDMVLWTTLASIRESQVDIAAVDACPLGLIDVHTVGRQLDWLFLVRFERRNGASRAQQNQGQEQFIAVHRSLSPAIEI